MALKRFTATAPMIESNHRVGGREDSFEKQYVSLFGVVFSADLGVSSN